VSSKTARIKRRHAARLRRTKRLRKAGRLPVHTLTERKCAEAARLRDGEDRLGRAKRARLGAVAASAAVGVGLAAGLTGLAVPAVASTAYPAIVSAVPSLSPVTSPYSFMVPGRHDELPHPEPPDPTLYAGDASDGGTASTSAGLVGLQPSGIPPLEAQRYGPWAYYSLLRGD
jgi:hypothetical protein